VDKKLHESNNVLFSVILIAIAVFLGLALTLLPTSGGNEVPGSSNTDGVYESIAEIKTGRLPGSEGYPTGDSGDAYFYLINTLMTFDRPDAQGNIMIENTVGNTCEMQVEIVLDDSRVVYLSPVLKPNQYISGDRLRIRLDTGVYNAKAYIRVFNPDDGSLIDTSEADVQLTINYRLF